MQIKLLFSQYENAHLAVKWRGSSHMENSSVAVNTTESGETARVRHLKPRGHTA